MVCHLHEVSSHIQEESSVQALKCYNKCWMPSAILYFSVSFMHHKLAFFVVIHLIIRRSLSKHCPWGSGSFYLSTCFLSDSKAALFQSVISLEKWLFSCLNPRFPKRLPMEIVVLLRSLTLWWCPWPQHTYLVSLEVKPLFAFSRS